MKSRRVRSFACAALFAVAAAGASACSVAMAAHQPSRKDVGVLSPGMPRNMVLAELGAPVSSERKAGQRVEIFAFTQGYRKGVKVSRAILHGSADVMTFGLWEVAGTPTEALLNGSKKAFEVTYDASDRVETVVPLRK